jgi:GTPase SAR1 family protein
VRLMFGGRRPLEHQTRREQIHGDHYPFPIWDTVGAEKFRALVPLYARDSKAAAIVFDMTRRRFFANVFGWVSLLRQGGHPVRAHRE